MGKIMKRELLQRGRGPQDGGSEGAGWKNKVTMCLAQTPTPHGKWDQYYKHGVIKN